VVVQENQIFGCIFGVCIESTLSGSILIGVESITAPSKNKGPTGYSCRAFSRAKFLNITGRAMRPDGCPLFTIDRKAVGDKQGVDRAGSIWAPASKRI